MNTTFAIAPEDCHCHPDIKHIDARGWVVLVTIKTGPYAGKRMAAHVYSDKRRIAGRLPYGGHVWKAGKQWIVGLPGGVSGGSFRTMGDAKEFIARQDRWT